ncbi:hypothetical protein I6F50_20050 [Pseudoalteromonas sp. NZS127_1]|uniref:hypothetical protein n=1 Tax=Alteromonadales TaxID=135622 RepID=UPI0013FD33BB|nr:MULTISPECIES: hypothetical protein [unclassified Pseudoalteromonas]MBG9997323.1 hypothetical protein [Pseudoalteromonas sp. NZS127_1]MBH0012290.1 hypothetical protein [Pseudoalteromonas sp. NZS100_1]MBH0021608.1 hypothetical protein [Pseudoalteromonas sp. SWXJ133]MBH0040930.1 hypothetical protein [Pseudoalteromonas sp. SWXJZ10B]MBH0052532.1 hypothetical protein [Pseudoalteromonas sp. SWYJZ19]
MNIKIKFSVLSLFTMLSFSSSASSSDYAGTAHVIKGEAEVNVSTLFTCKNGRSRPSPVGIKKYDNIEYLVPAKVQYEQKNFATDLYNECSKVTPKSLSEVNLSSVPIIEVDKDGEVITGYIFADNYFELFINGKLIAVDPIPFTPFNSNIVKFKVKKPYDIAIKVVDWEENSGLGSEDNRGKRFHPGDGGFIASFSDGTKTNSKWSAQTFYTSPVYDLKCAKEIGDQRLTTKCSTNGADKYIETYSLHWDIPVNWKLNESYLSWPNSVEFTEDEIGVNNKKAYMNFQEQFSGSGASFIWSSNLVLDNLVLFRYRVK